MTSKMRWIQPVCQHDGDVSIGYEVDVEGMRLVVADWSLSLTEDEREEFGSPIPWWAERVGR